MFNNEVAQLGTKLQQRRHQLSSILYLPTAITELQQNATPSSSVGWTTNNFKTWYQNYQE